MKTDFRKGSARACVAALSLVAVPAFAATTVTADLSLGYRSDDLRWNNASDMSGTAVPNIESELTFKDVHSAYLRYDGSATFDRGVYTKWGIGYGMIQDGKLQDSDYAGNDRSNETSRSENKISGDAVTDIYVAIGYAFKLPRATIAPYVGYSRNEQKYQITDGNQVIPATGPFGGLNSTYNATWKGPLAGVELTFPINASEIFARAEYHKPDYHGEGNWNLRADLAHPVSFSEDADGKGSTFMVGWRHAFTQGSAQKRSGLLVSFEVGKWSIDPGVDHLNNSDGTVVDSRFNEAEWKQKAINVGWWGRF